MSKKDSTDTLITENAKILASIVVDPQTTENVRIQIINKLLEDAISDSSFFSTMFDEKMSYEPCPHCGHMNHWLIPEDALNTMGYVTSKEDPEVNVYTTAQDCEEYQEACIKKKVTF